MQCSVVLNWDLDETYVARKDRADEYFYDNKDYTY